MKTITFLALHSQIGERWLASQIATEAASQADGQVIFIDMDWHRERATCKNPAEPNDLVSLAMPDVTHQLTAASSEGVSVAVLAAHASKHRTFYTVLAQSDLIVIVLSQNLHSLDYVQKFIKTMEYRDIPFVFLLNRMPPKKSVNPELAFALAQHGSVCPVVIPERPNPLDGSANCFDLHEPWASQRNRLWIYLSHRLRRNGQRSDIREFPRHRYDLPAEIATESKTMKCRLHDISGSGLSVETKEPLQTGECVKIRLRHIGLFNAVVIHNTRGRVGLQFKISLSAQQKLAGKLADSIFMSQIEALVKSSIKQRISSYSQMHAKSTPIHGQYFCPCAVRCIVIGNNKGGTGKSTIAIHLIVALLYYGYNVAALRIGDQQGTLERFLRNRQMCRAQMKLDLPMPFYSLATDANIQSLLPKLRLEHDYIIVDLPVSAARDAADVIAACDVLITPVNDSLIDLDALGRVEPETMQFVEEGQYARWVREVLQQADRKPRWLVTRNRLTTIDARNKRLVANAIDRISDAVGFTVIPGLVERVIYREHYHNGLTLSDFTAFESQAGLPPASHSAGLQELQELLAAIGVPAINARTVAPE